MKLFLGKQWWQPEAATTRSCNFSKVDSSGILKPVGSPKLASVSTAHFRSRPILLKIMSLEPPCVVLQPRSVSASL